MATFSKILSTRTAPGKHEACFHNPLQCDAFLHGEVARYNRIPWARRKASMAPSSRVPKTSQLGDNDVEPPSHALNYPAPLVLADDDLALDPSYPPQSFRARANLKERNPVTGTRKTVSVARSPSLGEALSGMIECAELKRLDGTEEPKSKPASLQPPRCDDVLAYLRAFYH